MNMEIIGPLLLSLLAGLSTMIGSLFIFFKINKVGEFISFCLSLSMTIMILISLFELIPSSLNDIILYHGKLYGIIIYSIIFIIGYASIYFLHMRIKSNDSNLYRIGVISMISLFLHNLPEGIAVFMSTYKSVDLGLKLFTAIILHNIPEGILIAVPLYYSGESRAVVLKMTLISSLSEPLGALLSYLILKDHITNLTLSYILIFVSGLMISLSINDIYKEMINYNKKRYIIYGIFTGIILILFLI